MDRHQRNVALLVAGALFIEIMDGTIVATAAPDIARSFDVTSTDIGVCITAYLLTVAALIPVSGWLSDRFGTRRVFAAAIALFTLASVLCAVSASLPVLAATRVLQGIGGAMMVPVGRRAVLRVTSKVDLVRAVALLTWPALAAPVVAPLIGGMLTTYASWRWIFLVNVPIGVIAFGLALKIIAHDPDEVRTRLDWLGAVLVCGAMSAGVLAAALLASPHPPWLAAATLAVLFVVLCVASVSHLRRTPDPLLELGMLRRATFRVAHAGGSVFRLTVNAVPFLVPLTLQDAFGWSAVRAGFVLVFVFVGNLGIKPATTPLLRRFGFRPVLVVATVAEAVSMALIAMLSAATPVMLILLTMVFSGAARSVGFTVYNTIAFADIEPGEISPANTLSATLQQASVGFGVAVGAIALRAGHGLAASLPAGASGLLGTSAVAPYRIAFLIIAVLTLVAVVEAVGLHPDSGDRIRPGPRTTRDPGRTGR